jgi:hypothetical protein
MLVGTRKAYLFRIEAEAPHLGVSPAHAGQSARVLRPQLVERSTELARDGYDAAVEVGIRPLVQARGEAVSGRERDSELAVDAPPILVPEKNPIGRLHADSVRRQEVGEVADDDGVAVERDKHIAPRFRSGLEDPQLVRVGVVRVDPCHDANRRTPPLEVGHRAVVGVV